LSAGVFPLDTNKVSGYDYGAPLPAGGWNGNGQSYGWNTHQGIDYGTKAGDPIRAPWGGTAKFEQGLLGYGNRLTLTLANGWRFVFGHVAAGSNGAVRQGAVIGTTGRNIGSAQGSVTLVEVHDSNGRAVNPHTILDPLFRGGATAAQLFGAASGQLMEGAGAASPPPPSPPGSGPDFGAAWKTLLDDLAAAPAEAQRNTAAQVGAIQNATNQITAGFKPVGDFFSSIGKMLEPKHLWTGLFVGTGVVMVAVGILIYFKGDAIVVAAQNTGKEAAKVGTEAAVAA
jgi:hypothetical protein